jgi:hypothetical protein
MATELVGGSWAQFAVASKQASAAPRKRYVAKTTLFDIRRPGAERLAAPIKRTPGNGIPGDVSRDEARVKNVAVASGLAAHLVP